MSIRQMCIGIDRKETFSFLHLGDEDLSQIQNLGIQPAAKSAVYYVSRLLGNLVCIYLESCVD